MKKSAKRSKKGSRGKKSAVIIMIVLIVVLVAIAGMLFIQGRLSRINQVTDTVPAAAVVPEEETFVADEEAGPDTLQPDQVEWKTAEAIEPEAASGVKNILLIGQDARSEQGRQRSDTMVICSINENTNTITMCSLMRDLYVPIPGYSDNRINSAYVIGGMPLLDDVIEQDFGVHIDGNLEVNLHGFLDAMSAVGDLDIELTQDEADYMNANPSLGSTNDESAEVWNLSAGMNSLTPTQALGYSRIRHIGHADYERTERQRRVLSAAFNKLAQSDVATLVRVSDEIFPCLTTDMSQSELLDLMKMVKANDMKLNSETYRIPVDGTYSSESIRGMAVLVPDLQANSSYLQQYLYGTPAGQS